MREFQCVYCFRCFTITFDDFSLLEVQETFRTVIDWVRCVDFGSKPTANDEHNAIQQFWGVETKRRTWYRADTQNGANQTVRWSFHFFPLSIDFRSSTMFEKVKSLFKSACDARTDLEKAYILFSRCIHVCNLVLNCNDFRSFSSTPVSTNQIYELAVSLFRRQLVFANSSVDQWTNLSVWRIS